MALVPQIDHRVGECLERIVYLTDSLEAEQQTPELVFPGKDALDGAEALLEDGLIEALLATTLFYGHADFRGYWDACSG